MKSTHDLLGASRWGVALAALLLCALASPASAKVVEFTATLRAGLGDGGNPPTISTPAANGLPACAKGLITHLNAEIPAAGFLEVSSGPAPQSIMDVRPYKFGTVGPIGMTTNGTNSRPSMMAGVNGMPEFFSSTCTVMFDEAHLTGMIEGRTQSSFAHWPAQNTVFITSVPTIMGTMSAPRHVKGPGLEQHRVFKSGGPGTFFVNVQSSLNQYISGMAGPNQFGGGFRASGGGVVHVAATVGVGFTAEGSWTSGPRIGGHGLSPQTQTVTMSGTFTVFPGSAMIPVLLRAWLMPNTTGTVVANDSGGDFVTKRVTMGTDNRTSLGEFGTLTMVSPFAANLAELDIWFGGNLSGHFTFLPEPGPTGLLAAGIVGVLALHFVHRRRR